MDGEGDGDKPRKEKKSTKDKKEKTSKTTTDADHADAVQLAKDKVLKMLDDNMKQNTQVIEARSKHRKDVVLSRADQRKRKAIMDIDLQTKWQELDVDADRITEIIRLQLASGEQKTAVELKALALTCADEETINAAKSKAEETQLAKQRQIGQSRIQMQWDQEKLRLQADIAREKAAVSQNAMEATMEYQMLLAEDAMQKHMNDFTQFIESRRKELDGFEEFLEAIKPEVGAHGACTERLASMDDPGAIAQKRDVAMRSLDESLKAAVSDGEERTKVAMQAVEQEYTPGSEADLRVTTPSGLGTDMDGWVLYRVHGPELKALEPLLRVDRPDWLGQGRDAKSYGPYSKVELFAAWRLDVPDRHQIYEVQRRVVKRDCKAKAAAMSTKLDGFRSEAFLLDPACNEKWFLHGTQPSLVLPILSTGLNERLSSIRGLFGAGIYLAEDMEKADQYATPDDGQAEALAGLHRQLFRDGLEHPGGDLFYVFVVRALCGLPTSTLNGRVDKDTNGQLFAGSDRRELATVSGQPFRYHCLVVETGAAVKRYREFVFYNASRISICYLIAYRRLP